MDTAFCIQISLGWITKATILYGFFARLQVNLTSERAFELFKETQNPLALTQLFGASWEALVSRLLSALM
jgi:hypothetical protein